MGASLPGMSQKARVTHQADPLTLALCWSWAFRDGPDRLSQGDRYCYYASLEQRKLASER